MPSESNRSNPTVEPDAGGPPAPPPSDLPDRVPIPLHYGRKTDSPSAVLMAAAILGGLLVGIFVAGCGGLVALIAGDGGAKGLAAILILGDVIVVYSTFRTAIEDARNAARWFGISMLIGAGATLLLVVVALVTHL